MKRSLVDGHEARAAEFGGHWDSLHRQSLRLSRVEGKRHSCPCCQYLTLDERGAYEVCAVCFWEDDGQDEADLVCCATELGRGNEEMLRDVREEDLPIFFEHQRDPEAHRMAAFPPRERDAFMLHWHTKVIGDATARKRTIVVDDRVVGNVGSWDAGGSRLVGYWIGREYWGQGIATAALSEFLCEERTRPLCAYVAVENRGSIRVLQKCGFRQIGGIPLGSDRVEEYLFQLGA
ncbi:MAG: GNAT family N-acetyltransferase [Deltaproteobacteria bacterium]